MSILENDAFCTLVKQIEGSLMVANSPEFYQLKQKITDEIRSGDEFTFHQKEALTSQDLQDTEISLGVTADIEGRYDANHTIDQCEDRKMEDGSSYLESSEKIWSNTKSLYPRVSKQYRDINIEPRGARVALYDAIEQYINKSKLEPYSKDEHTCGIIYNILRAIRYTAFAAYESNFVTPDDSFDKKNQDIATAHRYADAYMLKALNARNVSENGQYETVKDLMCRQFGEAIYNQCFEHSSHSREGYASTNARVRDVEFFSKMQTAAEQTVTSTRASATHRSR